MKEARHKECTIRIHFYGIQKMRNLIEGGRSQNGGRLLAGSNQKRAWAFWGVQAILDFLTWMLVIQVCSIWENVLSYVFRICVLFSMDYT